MTMTALVRTTLKIAALTLVGTLVAARPPSAAETTVAALAQRTHFHGLAVGLGVAPQLYLATHHGLYAVAPDGTARQISDVSDDFMGFTPHPADAQVLYASGHPAHGGNLGVMVSRDGGTTWSKLADGVGGPVDFHQMDVSKADPRVIYGVHGGLQRSDDGGRSWRRAGTLPEGVFGLAASSLSADTLYAAARGGLQRSTDGGRSWQPAHPQNRPATMVHVAHHGQVYAFLAGVGLVAAREDDLEWRVVSGPLSKDVMLHLAVEPNDDRHLYAATVNPETRAQSLRESLDGGATWADLGAR